MVKFKRRISRNPHGVAAMLILITSLISIPFLYHYPPRKHYIPHHWTSEITGWYNRSTIVHDTSHMHFTSLFDFQLIHTTSSWGSEALRVAFFDGEYCITETAVLKLQHEDFVGIMELIAIARARNELVRYYAMNTMVRDIATQNIRIVGSDGHLKLYSAYGFDRRGSYSDASWLPEELWQLFGLVGMKEMGGLESEGEDFERLKGELKGLLRVMRKAGRPSGPGFED